jgi:hypothetical protein
MAVKTDMSNASSAESSSEERETGGRLLSREKWDQWWKQLKSCPLFIKITNLLGSRNDSKTFRMF